ncbi:MAG: TetR/AcrR family transcriptional regulator [Abyssibacter sp.]|uniref:TetR/AcrR family transcriptional regulator n=1 Tax=Abyssibacter sp. TaxID=2320200 RepID=UPI002E9A69E1|nr:TetR/AcrR family transcriptional regulator [Pseudomonadota bacterium]
MGQQKPTLSAEDWADAALEAMADGGLDSVAVEPLARKLGVTKGSFYWHFANRDSLVRAAVERWAQRETEQIIERARGVKQPRKRIQTVFKAANGSEREGHLYLALAAASRDPRVADFVHKVSQRRLEFLTECYEALGLIERDARKWATFAYSTFLGTLQLRRDNPSALPAGPFFNEYLRLLIETLIPRPGEQAPAASAERAA